MVDRLAILLERFAVTASVFHAGALCGINTLDGEDEAGQLHLVRRGPLQVTHGPHTVQVEVPSLLLYPRPLPHRFVTDPQHGADMACASLHFEGGRLNPISAALPDFICMPLTDLHGGNAALELLFEEAFEQRCGRAAMVNRLFEVVMIQVLRQLMEGARCEVACSPGWVIRGCGWHWWQCMRRRRSRGLWKTWPRSPACHAACSPPASAKPWAPRRASTCRAGGWVWRSRHCVRGVR